MPTFTDSVTAPRHLSRSGRSSTIRPGSLHGGPASSTWTSPPQGQPRPTSHVYYAEEPDVHRPQRREASPSGLRIMISCLTTNLRFTWQLEPVGGGEATRITALVDIPEDQTYQLESQQAGISTSLRRLAALAAGTP